MSSNPSTPNAEVVALPATPSPSLKPFNFDFTATNYEMDDSISEEEQRFYLKMYPTVDVVNQRKVHCTVCRAHIGTAASTENNIKMHPILRVTHCIKCHDFYNSGEFSKGEDGSELYCRWCGQGGEVYCCSTCPYVFCKSCIIKNLSRGVIVDIEQNENWNCFKCTSKILWPLRAQHWALINYIKTQKNGLQSLQLSESVMRKQMQKDLSTCCRLAKAKANSLSDSMESLESNVSKRSHASSVHSVKKSVKPQTTSAKRPKLSNDEVVCTPDLLSMLEPDCEISVARKSGPRSQTPAANIITTTPRIVTVQQNYTDPSPTSNGSSTAGPRSSLPPPLVLSSSGMRYRQLTPAAAAMVRRTVVPNAVRTPGPVFHTINGFRVDLNSAALQDSYRLPNGRLIQVKRQLPSGGQPSTTITRNPPVITPQASPGPQPRINQNSPSYGSNIGIYNPQSSQQPRAPHVNVRVNHGGQIHSMNTVSSVAPTTAPTCSNGGTTIMVTPASAAKGPTLVRHVFPTGPIGTARAQLQEQIFNAMEICTHLTGKVQTLTHSNAYNQARSYMDLKELYIHLSYLMTYAIGRFKQLQDKCLVDMREMGFKNDANSLENGQLAAEKQASDDEDNEIQIVEPKTDTITIDSDNEEESSSITNVCLPKGLKITSVKSTAPEANLANIDPVTGNLDPNMDIDVASFSSSILASLLEVDITEGIGEIKPKSSISPGGTIQKKQPRKKTTNKPNPALLQLERQRMEEMKRNDIKLKMKVVVKLQRAEEEFEVARKWVEQNAKAIAEKSAAAECDANGTCAEPTKELESQVDLEKTDNVDTELSEAIQNLINESKDYSEKSAAEEQEKPSEDDLHEKMETSDDTKTLSDDNSEEKTKTNDTENETSINANLEDNENPAGNEISADEDAEPEKTADKEENKTETTADKDPEVAETLSEEPMEVSITIETKEDEPETQIEAEIIDETSETVTAKAELNNKEDIETDKPEPDKKDAEADEVSSKADSVPPAMETADDTETAETKDRDADESASAVAECTETTSRNNSPGPAEDNTPTVTESPAAPEAEKSTETATPSSPLPSESASNCKESSTEEKDKQSESPDKSNEESNTSTRKDSVDTITQPIDPQSDTNGDAI